MSPHYTPSFVSNAQRVQIPGVKPIPKLAKTTYAKNNKWRNISAKQLRENKHFRKTTPRTQTFPQNISEKQLREHKHFREIKKCRNKYQNAEIFCILVLDAELFTSNVSDTTPTKPILHD
jgi:hypothetical protein